MLRRKMWYDAARVLKKMAANQSKIGVRDYALLRVGTFCATRSAEVFGLTWNSFLGNDLFIHGSAWKGTLHKQHTKIKPRTVALDSNTQVAIENWKKICTDTKPESLMFCANPGIPFTSRNWLERNLQRLGKELGISTPLTFQVLRRSFATHNQRDLKNVQSHLRHESVTTTANLYVQNVPEEVRRTQDRYAAEIDNWTPKKAAGSKARPKASTSKLDGTGRKLDAEQNEGPR